MTTAEWVAVGSGAVALVLSVYQFRRARRPARTSRSVDVAPGAAANIDLLLSTTARRRRLLTPSTSLAALRTADATSEAQEQVRDAAHVIEQLTDIRDGCGAAEAVFWRWDEARDLLTPAAWSTPGVDRPQHFDVAVWGPLARWAAEGNIVVLDPGENTAPPRFAAAPVIDDPLLIGVLTVANEGGLLLSRQKAKDWLPRYAAQVVRLVAVSEDRREFARHMRQNRALLNAVQRIQNQKTLDLLAASICETALQVSSAASAALIRWRADARRGWLIHCMGEFRQARGEIDKDTLVFNACESGMVQILEDTSPMGRDVSLILKGDTGWRGGALGIIPLNRGQDVLGAIVVASTEPGHITQDEVDNLKGLAAFALGPLEMAWEIDAVNKRASTDGLTGLVNRRAFDEHFKRLLNETDRFGQPLALILGDIDHFKRINDTWGHEAGDEVLRQVAKRMGECVRTVDVFARYGGEEFAILLPQTSVLGATDLADRLRHAVGAWPVKFKGEEISVTASFGVASYPDAVPARDGLFRAADRALYAAKQSGRNCVRSSDVSAGQ